MKKIFLLAVLLFTFRTYGQTGARYDGVVMDQNGKPVVGINVRVCTSRATGQPCTPLANIYSDVNLQFPVANPTTTDFLGNFYFYVSSTTYELEFSGATLTTKQVPDVTITAPGGGTGFVSNVTGTPNQITVVNNTTTPVVSLPSPLILPGGLTVPEATVLNGPLNTNSTSSFSLLASFLAGLTSTSLTGSSLTPGNCLQGGAGGLITSTLIPCAANLLPLNNIFTGSLNTFEHVSAGSLDGACLLDGVQYTSLASAVACAGSRGGQVWVPPSSANYTLAATVTLPTGINLACLGSPGLSIETNGSCTFSVAVGQSALEISGPNVTVQGLHFISLDSVTNTDDCIRIQGDYARIVATTCEHFGRDGFRIDSTGGSGFADFTYLENARSYFNFGDGFHWVPSGVDENAGVCIRCDAYNNAGYGFHAEEGADNVIIDPTVQNNTAGGYYLGGSTTAWNFINPYCESGTGSSFTFAAGSSWHRAQMPFFGQCTTITNNGGLTNQYNYGTAGVAPQNNGLYFGPDAGAASPVIYEWASGLNANNGWASMQDITDGVVINEYNPGGKIFYFLVPLQGTANANQYYVSLTGNSNGSHNDSGFMQTGSANGCTTGSSQGSVCSTPVTITWPVAFADASYEAICSPLGAGTNFPGTPYVLAGQTATGITVNYYATTAAAASWTVIQCVAIHN